MIYNQQYCALIASLMIKDLITSVVESVGMFPFALLCALLGSLDLNFCYETLAMAVRNPGDKAFKVIG